MVSLKAVVFRHEASTKRSKVADDELSVLKPPLGGFKVDEKSAALSMVTPELSKRINKEKASVNISNTGVAARNQRDIDLLERAPTEEQTFSILMKKSDLYEKMIRGEVDTTSNEDILVDFEAKRWSEPEEKPSGLFDEDEELMYRAPRPVVQKSRYTRTMLSADMKREQEREEYEANIKNEEDMEIRKEVEIAMVQQLHMSAEKERQRHLQQKEKKLKVLAAKAKITQAKIASLKKESLSESITNDEAATKSLKKEEDS
eukprot:TRINITY_DN6928_c0_g1_i4.p1 TRINITY_DN6928_c0_g1~~TRINITY_DN6928_c0_g1_i4.p1  ORF type:complete len:260 (-),score=69.53 TRINITY_DN6928_c0_g1_i4:5-784(-)